MTIFALSSGNGISGVAVIRISGPETKNILKMLTKSELPEPRKATLLKMNNINTSELIDEGIILWFPGPNSYTGEDMAELHVHGGKSIIKEIQNTISSTKKCRLAEPGEFTKISFLNGKINLLKAEAIGDLISAETEIQRKQALNIIKGKSYLKFKNLREQLIKILSHIEAKIDFPEDEIPDELISKIKNDLSEIENDISKILDDQKIGERIRLGFKIAIVGPPNTGKSSLMNYLSKREISIVSDIAGTTRDILETHLNFDGYPVIISDTAGIRESKDVIENKGINLALKKAEDADLKIIIIEPKSVDFQRFFGKYLKENSLLVINKCDLGEISTLKSLKKFNPIKISIKDEMNIDQLINRIKENMKLNFSVQEDIFITRERHRENLEECLKNLKSFRNKSNLKEFDKAAEDLRLATRHLGKIIGKVDVEEILASIFNDFCIGK
tara:strand:- start:247 stop:1578 length:1332 start_codon:yes stop_codon:yes gene_type:complete